MSKQLFPQFGEMDEHTRKRLVDSMRRGFVPSFGVPVLDENGDIIDGKHRLEAAQELGIDIPTKVVEGWTDEQKWDYAYAQNELRRQNPPSVRREIMREQLRRNPERSNREIARDVGADHKTVAAQREQMESAGEIPQQTPQLNQYARGERAAAPSDWWDQDDSDDQTPRPSNHRGECSFRVMFFYPAPNEATRARVDMPYVRERQEQTWTVDAAVPTRRIPLNAGAPKSEEEWSAICDEIRDAIYRAGMEHPPATMDPELVSWK